MPKKKYDEMKQSILARLNAPVAVVNKVENEEPEPNHDWPDDIEPDHKQVAYEELLKGVAKTRKPKGYFY